MHLTKEVKMLLQYRKSLMRRSEYKTLKHFKTLNTKRHKLNIFYLYNLCDIVSRSTCVAPFNSVKDINKYKINKT